MSAPPSDLRRFAGLLALGIWLGALLLLGGVVAPTVFAVLGTSPGGRAQAADLVGEVITGVHLIGLVSGLIFLAAFGWRRGPATWLPWGMIALTVLAHIVAMSIHTLRLQGATGGTQFRWLHATSTILESGVFLLGLIAFWKVLRRER